MNQNAMSIWTFSFWMRVTSGARQSSNEPSQRRSEALAGVKTNTRKASENDEIQNAFLFLRVINSLGYSSIDTTLPMALARRVPHPLTSQGLQLVAIKDVRCVRPVRYLRGSERSKRLRKSRSLFLC